MISALLPEVHVVRDGTKLVGAKHDPILWADRIETECSGRARISLTDQSILSLGSSSAMTIKTHDARAQQTEVEVHSGKARFEVTKMTIPSGYFRVQTPHATIRVRGTDFMVDVRKDSTRVICLSGAVTVERGNDESAACSGSETLSVIAGEPLQTHKTSPDEVQSVIQDVLPTEKPCPAPQ
jgi:ferric-dicitrate binding protein FerR (iron transport regulator)